MSANGDDVATTASAEGGDEEGRAADDPAAAAAVGKSTEEPLPPAPPPAASVVATAAVATAAVATAPAAAADRPPAPFRAGAPPNPNDPVRPPLPSSSLRRKQLAEFNSWLYRWNNYQQHLASYWQGRYAALYRRGGASGGGGGDEGGERGGGKRRKRARKSGGKGVVARVDKVEEKWNLRFRELVDFKEEHGHTNVPKEFTYKYSPPLGHWVGRMRHLHKKGTLDPDRVARLLSVDFEFVIAKSDKIQFSVVWYKSYQALVAFQEMNGHLEVPAGYKPQPDMAELDGWITRQRKHFRDGKLPDHLVAKLRGMGLNLGGRGRPFGLESEELWSRNYKALAAYCDEHGDCDVPERYDDDRELGNWVKAQRDTYSDGMLPEDRIKLLNQVGFNFYHGRKSQRAQTTDPWSRRLAELKAYKEKTGNTNVPKKFALNMGLGEFVYNQRMAHKDGLLPAEKARSLEEMGFEFKIKRVRPGRGGKNVTNWERRFAELEEYKEKHGGLHVPAGYEASPNLAAWTKRQRKAQREGVLKGEKYERLKALGVDFGGPKQEKRPWMEQYEALVAFRNEHGHNDIPVHYGPNPPLYYWIGTQKQSYKKGKLSEDKIALLKDIDFNFEAKSRDRSTTRGTRGGNKPFLDPEEFNSLCERLEEYKEEHGDIDVPQREGRLGSFVHYMRFYVKGGKLSQDHIDRLNELGFSWNVTSDRWNARFEALAKFKADHGNFDVPSTNSLYSWVGYQRKLFAEDNLPQDRVEMLVNIDFDFDIPAPKKGFSKETPEMWEESFRELLAFHEEHGHCKVSEADDPDPSLVRWVSSQQNKYNKGSLTDEQIDRLNEIKFNFTQDTLPKKLGGALRIPRLEPVDRESYLEDLWDKSYRELVAYRDHFGHCNIPISYDANPSLGAWAFSQKMAHKKDRLSRERYDKLEELGFPFGPGKKTVVEEV